MCASINLHEEQFEEQKKREQEIKQLSSELSQVSLAQVN
jgi:hypothetical protein